MTPHFPKAYKAILRTLVRYSFSSTGSVSSSRSGSSIMFVFTFRLSKLKTRERTLPERIKKLLSTTNFSFHTTFTFIAFSIRPNTFLSSLFAFSRIMSNPRFLYTCDTYIIATSCLSDNLLHTYFYPGLFNKK